MKKNILIGLGTFVIGVFLSLLVVWNSAPSIMIHEDEVGYSFDEAIMKYQDAVKAKGWKIPTIHDLQATMTKFGKDVKKVMVFELCHPEHAYKILSKDQERVVSSLMPCRVAIYEKSNGKVYASRMNTALMGKMMSGVIPEVMAEASRESEEMLSAILKK